MMGMYSVECARVNCLLSDQSKLELVIHTASLVKSTAHVPCLCNVVQRSHSNTEDRATTKPFLRRPSLNLNSTKSPRRLAPARP